jgi:hypothetical protein
MGNLIICQAMLATIREGMGDSNICLDCFHDFEHHDKHMHDCVTVCSEYVFPPTIEYPNIFVWKSISRMNNQTSWAEQSHT